MTVQEAINKRYSTRYYMKNEIIDKEIINKIVEAGYLAPNGFGCEPWKFIVVENNLEKLSESVYGQKHVTDASFVVILLNLKMEYVIENPNILTDKWEKMEVSKEKQVAYLDKLKGVGTQYFREQLMFAAANMTIQASALNVGSVVVGGFDKNKVEDVINIDKDKYEVGLIVDFGISTDLKPKVRVKRDKDEVIEYKKI